MTAEGIPNNPWGTQELRPFLTFTKNITTLLQLQVFVQSL
jgi:hypothetical protein